MFDIIFDYLSSDAAKNHLAPLILLKSHRLIKDNFCFEIKSSFHSIYFHDSFDKEMSWKHCKWLTILLLTLIFVLYVYKIQKLRHEKYTGQS